MIVQTIPNDSQRLYADDAKDLYESPKNAGSVGKNCVFRPIEKSPAQTSYTKNLCPSATVVRLHDDALAAEYVVSSTTLVVVESDGPVDINIVDGPYRSLWMTSCTPSHARSLSDS